MTLENAGRRNALGADNADNDLRRKIRALGADLQPATFAGTAALMAPLVTHSDAVKVERDITYGTHPRHRLDLFHVPAPAGAAARPVIIYVHGGGFVQGDKGNGTTPFYDNVGRWAAQAGAIGVTMNYRLAPDHPWPAAAHDIAAALDLLHELLPTRGGNPGAVFLMGQSAGAVHVASYVAMTDLHRRPRLAGAIMLSGVYAIDAFPHGPLEHAHYGTDASRYTAQSSLDGLVDTPIPCLFSVAEHEPGKFQHQALLLNERWFAKRGTLPRVLYLQDQNHLSPALGIGRPGDLLTREIEAFVATHTPR